MYTSNIQRYFKKNTMNVFQKEMMLRKNTGHRKRVEYEPEYYNSWEYEKELEDDIYDLHNYMGRPRFNPFDI